LLKKKSIEEYLLSYSLEKYPDIFPLTCITSSHCPLCNQEHTSDNAYIIRNKKSYSFYCHHANQKKEPEVRKPLIKLTIDELAKKREKRFSELVKLKKPRISDSNDHFV